MQVTDKRALRKAIKARVLQLTVAQRISAATRVLQAIRADADFRRSQHILIFWPLPDEVDIRPLLSLEPSKTYYLPVVSGNDLLIKPCRGPMIEGAFHILEPQGDEVVDPALMECILVPGVGFDVRGHRLGRGKGFYDRFLTTTDAVRIGVCYAAQRVPELPLEPWDQPVDKLFLG